MSLYQKRDPNESSGTRANRNYCLCGKADPNLPFITDLERIETYVCEKCQKNKENTRSLTVNFSENKPLPKFTFLAGGENNDWIIEISKKGIKFNHEVYPNVSPEGFAEAFIRILETQYDMTFEKRKVDLECDFCEGVCKCGLRQKNMEKVKE